jgi:quercetin dioxygenase-like cupin family protein
LISHPRLTMLATLALLPATATGAYAVGHAQQKPAQATRTALAQAVNPAGGRGRTLGLSRVTIPPKTRLALHRHPGTQIAYIQKGTLTYTVRTGAVNVYRGVADADLRVVRRIGAGQTGSVRAGEWVIERPSTVHLGANKTGRPVRILLASLFKNGSPSTIPVPE